MEVKNIIDKQIRDIENSIVRSLGVPQSMLAKENKETSGGVQLRLKVEMPKWSLNQPHEKTGGE